MKHTPPPTKDSAALTSVASSGLLTCLKFAVALSTGSLAILSEAIHSLIDVGATVITWIAVRWADLPPDDEHHYGHAKIENLAALFESLLLWATAMFIGFEAVTRLSAGGSILVIGWWAPAVLLIGLGVDIWRSRTLRKAALAHSSAALAADATHFEADIYASLAVLAGLGLSWLGWRSADSVAALGVAGFIAWLGYGLARETLSSLLDRAPDGIEGDLSPILAREDQVLRVSHFRARQAGPITYLAIVVEVPRTLPEPTLAALKAKIENNIRLKYPRADISLVLQPVALDSETVQQRVMAIAALQGLSLHHLLVQEIRERLAVSFDVEVQGATALGQAHGQVTDLEYAIRQALGGSVEVESHIEPIPADRVVGRDASGPLRRSIENSLNKAAANEKDMRDIHNIRVRSEGRQVYLHYHCRFRSSLSVELCHAALDRVEARLVSARPSLKRVIAHAEPLGHVPHRL